MARTTAELVRGVIELDDALDDSLLDPAINTANRITTKVCAESEDDYEDSDLTDIETWLAAHFLAVNPPNAANVVDSVDVITTRIESKVDLGLNNTRWGQAAMLADTFGNLATWNNDLFNQKPGKKIRPSVNWLGSESDCLEEVP